MSAQESKLIDALQKQNDTPGMVPSRSTPYIPQRRASITPIPTRTNSFALLQRNRLGSKMNRDVKLLPRLEEENAKLPQQDSIDFILAQIERQNALLDADPKSVCIQSNELKAHLSTLHNLVSDSSGESTDDIDWEFWSALTNDYSGVTLKLPHLVSAKLRAGIPDKVRGVIWQAMTQSGSLHLETVYGQLVAEHSPYERIIQRDLARTFPHVDMFKQEGGDGQRALESVLKAYSLYDSLVGYCQGLAFLVGPLLMNMPEQQAFCVFVRVMETYEMRSMFTLNMEGLQLRLYQFSHLLAQILPEVSDHLAHHTVNPPMYASQWFLTLFAYAFPIDLVLRIYDIVFAEGAAETIMRVAIALLQQSQDRILAMNEFEDILDCVTTKLYDAYEGDPGRVIADAMNLSGLITKDKMDDIAELYYREIEEEKKRTEQVLAVRLNFWSRQESSSSSTTPSDKPPQKTRRDSGSWLLRRKSLTKPKAELPPQDMAIFHEQIEELLVALSDTQKEQLQLKQDLVKMKMDKMDAEAERDALRLTLETHVRSRDEEDATESRLRSENRDLRRQLQSMRHQNDAATETQTKLVEQLVDLKNKCDDMEQEKTLLRRQAEQGKEKDRLIRTLTREKQALLRQLELLSKERIASQSHRRNSHGDSSHGSGSHDNRPHLHSMDDLARCRELEQSLAEAKLRIAQLETARSAAGNRSSTHMASGRPKSLPPPKSLGTANKRASLYGRLWSALGTTQDANSAAGPVCN